MPQKPKGSFCPEVRRRMRETGIELHIAEHSKNPYFTGQTPEFEEFREGGYLRRAKVLVLREFSQNKS